MSSFISVDMGPGFTKMGQGVPVIRFLNTADQFYFILTGGGVQRSYKRGCRGGAVNSFSCDNTQTTIEQQKRQYKSELSLKKLAADYALSLCEIHSSH